MAPIPAGDPSEAQGSTTNRNDVELGDRFRACVGLDKNVEDNNVEFWMDTIVDDNDGDKLVGTTRANVTAKRSRRCRNLAIAFVTMVAAVGLLWGFLPDPRVAPKDIVMEARFMHNGSVGINVSAPAQPEFSSVHKATISSLNCAIAVAADDDNDIQLVQFVMEGSYIVLTEKVSPPKLESQELRGIATVVDFNVLRSLATEPARDLTVSLDCSVTTKAELYWGIIKLTNTERHREVISLSGEWQVAAFESTASRIASTTSNATVVERMLEWLNHTWTTSSIDGVVIVEPTLPALLAKNPFIASCRIHLPDVSYDLTPTVLGEMSIDAPETKMDTSRAIMRVGSGATTWELVDTASSVPSQGKLYVACASGSCDQESVLATVRLGMQSATTHPAHGVAFSATAAPSNSLFFNAVLGEQHSTVVTLRGRTGMRRYIQNDYPDSRCIEAELFGKWRGVACGDLSEAGDDALFEDFPHAEVIVAPPGFFDDADSLELPIFQFQAALTEADRPTPDDVQSMLSFQANQDSDSQFQLTGEMLLVWDEDTVVDHTLRVDFGMVENEGGSTHEVMLYAVLDVRDDEGESEWMMKNTARQIDSDTSEGDWIWPLNMVITSLVSSYDEQQMKLTATVSAHEDDGAMTAEAELTMEGDYGDEKFRFGTTVDIEAEGLDDGNLAVYMAGLDGDEERLQVQFTLTSGEQAGVDSFGFVFQIMYDETTLLRAEPSLTVSSDVEDMLGITFDGRIIIDDDTAMQGDLDVELDFREDVEIEVEGTVVFGDEVSASIDATISQGEDPLEQDVALDMDLAFWDDVYDIRHTHTWSIADDSLTVDMTSSLAHNTDNKINHRIEFTGSIDNDDVVLEELIVTDLDLSQEQLFLALRMLTSSPRGEHDQILDIKNIAARWKTVEHSTDGSGYLQHGAHDGFPDTTWRVEVKNEDEEEKFYANLEIEGKPGFETELMVDDRLHIEVNGLVRTDGTEWMVGSAQVTGHGDDEGLEGSATASAHFDQEEWLWWDADVSGSYNDRTETSSGTLTQTLRTKGTPRWSHAITGTGRANDETWFGELDVTDQLDAGGNGDLYVRVDVDPQLDDDGLDVEIVTVLTVPAWEADLDLTHDIEVTFSERELSAMLQISENEEARRSGSTLLKLMGSLVPHGRDSMEDFFENIGVSNAGMTASAIGVAADETFLEFATVVATDGALEGVDQPGKITCIDMDMEMNFPFDMDMTSDMRSSLFQFPWNLNPEDGNNKWMTMEHMTMEYDMFDVDGSMAETNEQYASPPSCDATATLSLRLKLQEQEASSGASPASSGETVTPIDEPTTDEPAPTYKLVVTTELEGITPEEFDEEAEAAFKTVIANTFSDVDPEDVIIISVEAVERRRRSLLAAGVMVEYEVLGFESEHDATEAKEEFVSAQDQVLTALQGEAAFSGVTGVSSEVSATVDESDDPDRTPVVPESTACNATPHHVVTVGLALLAAIKLQLEC